MTDPTCVCGCDRPCPDGYARAECAARVRLALLGDDRQDDRPGLVDTAPAARDIAYGIAVVGTGGGSSGKPGSRMPLDLAVAAKLDAVQGSVTTWARHVAEERSGGLWVVTEPPRREPIAGPLCRSRYECGHDSCKPIRDPESVKAADPLEQAARYLAHNLEWLRHRPECDEAFSDLLAAAGVVRAIVAMRGGRKYLGPCGATLRPRPCCDLHNENCEPSGDLCCQECTEAAHATFPVPHLDGSHCVLNTMTCEGDVYGYPGAASGRCRTCGAEHDQGERQAWLAEEASKAVARASLIADALRINVNTIRSWAFGRPEVVAENGVVVREAKPPVLFPRDHDSAGRPLYLVGDVRELARQAAERREAARAKREQRETAEMGA
jgi:hypothetical protein